MARKIGFKDAFANSYKDVAHSAMLETMRQLAERPERDSQIKARQSENDLRAQEIKSKQANDDLIPDKKKEMQARADFYSKQHQNLLDAGTGKLKPEDMVKLKAGADAEVARINSLLNGSGLGSMIMDDSAKAELAAEKQRHQDTSDFYANILKSKAPGQAGAAASAPAVGAATAAPAAGGADGASAATTKAPAMTTSPGGRPRVTYPDGTVGEYDGTRWIRVQQQ
jgi:hypothetical protein